MIRTLVVEDDVAAAGINTSYLGRVAGFASIGVARTGTEAVTAVATQPVDLMLLDFHLPDMNGLQVCRALRSGRPSLVDIIAVTADRDVETVRKAIAYGVVQYLIKPYSFATFREKLERYGAYRGKLDGRRVTDQHEVDRTLETLRGSSTSGVPKGLSPATYELIVGILREAETPLSSSEVADAAGLSRVCARRYLEHLHRQNLALLFPRYGSTGRPEHRYHWTSKR
jgi:response regulator of citrate/malate metabolism